MKEEVFPKRTAFFRSGFSLIEVMIVVGVLMIVGIVLARSVLGQTSKARDARRKDSLEKIRVAFEDYYNDNQCYPELETLATCGSTALAPYLKAVPCDPLDEAPYVYFSLRGDVCRGYRVLVRLENTNDPNIESMGCDATNGCYWDDPAYNFGIAMGDFLVGGEWEEEEGDGAWVIGDNGVCQFYSPEQLDEGDCPTEYLTQAACFAVSGCTGNCSEEEVPLYLRCER